MRMRKTKKTVKTIIEELEKTGLISSACAKAKIPRSTYYRWISADIDFRFQTEKAIEIGRSNMVDFAESKVIKNIQDGSQRAAEFYLRNNDDRYRNSYARDYWKQVDMMKDKYNKDYRTLTMIRNALFNALPIKVLKDFAFNNSVKRQDNSIDNRRLNQQEIEKEVQKIIGSDIYRNITKKLMESEGISIKDIDRPPMPDDKDEINYDDD